MVELFSFHLQGQIYTCPMFRSTYWCFWLLLISFHQCAILQLSRCLLDQPAIIYPFLHASTKEFNEKYVSVIMIFLIVICFIDFKYLFLKLFISKQQSMPTPYLGYDICIFEISWLIEPKYLIILVDLWPKKWYLYSLSHVHTHTHTCAPTITFLIVFLKPGDRLLPLLSVCIVDSSPSSIHLYSTESYKIAWLRLESLF